MVVTLQIFLVYFCFNMLYHGTNVGVPMWVATVLNLVLFHMLFSYMWPQIVLLDQPLRLTLKNSLNCMIAFLPHALAAALVTILFWGLVILCMPLGLLLMLAFCVHINAFPVISSAGDLRSIFLPALTLALAMSSKYTRQVRTAVLEEMNQDYVVGARARGVRESVILWRNVFPNALLPLITMFGLSVGSLLGGTSVVEVIFSYPGLGNLAVSAITSSDYNLIQGYVLWLALIYMVINLLVDASYGAVDPRMRAKEQIQ